MMGRTLKTAALALLVAAGAVPARAQVRGIPAVEAGVAAAAPSAAVGAIRGSLEAGLGLPAGASALTALPDLHLQAFSAPRPAGSVLGVLTPAGSVKVALVVRAVPELWVPAAAAAPARSAAARAPPSSARPSPSRELRARAVLRTVEDALTPFSAEELKDPARARAALGRVFDGLRSRGLLDGMTPRAGVLSRGATLSPSRGASAARRAAPRVPAPAAPEPRKRFVVPFVTAGLIGADVAIHALIAAGVLGLPDWVLAPFLVKSAWASGGPAALVAQSWTFVSSMFVHGSWGHLIGNMAVLLPLGAAGERLLGRWRTLGVFLGAGLFGGLLWTALVWSGPPVYSLGASGAIMGLAGALFPRALRDQITGRALESESFLAFMASSLLVFLAAGEILMDGWGAIGQISAAAPAAGHAVNHVVHLAGFAWGLLAASWWSWRGRAAKKNA